MLKSRVISCSLSPNTEADDVFKAVTTLFSPWVWKRGKEQPHVAQWFKDYFHTETVALCNSGRSALLTILQAFDIRNGDEVIIQAFTCVAVPNSVLWAGAKPVFADIDDTLNIDSTDIEKKITKRTKAIIVQHTFGVPAHMDTIVPLAKKHGLILIEDCAHSLGASYKGKKIGTFGDAAFFSFGRDKVVSSVWGGAAIINDKCQMTNAKWKLKKIENELPKPSYFWIFQQLLHPIAFSLILPLYDVWIGKILLFLLQKMKLLSLPVSSQELVGGKPIDFPAQFPNALAAILVNQLNKLKRYNRQRQEIASLYRASLEHRKDIHVIDASPESIYLRFPILVNTPSIYLKRARKQGILLGNWYHNIIDPNDVSFEAFGYKEGSCHNAEDAACRMINLPTRISPDDAQKVLSVLV